MQVPGPDGKRGYGGMCFPKDTKAFANYARSQGKPLKLLEKAIELNEGIRKV
jgi:UDPglucose 6-dehydrogenase